MYGPVLLSALLVPFLALLALGLGLPLAKAVVGSVGGGDRFAEPYRVLARDPVFWKVLARTLRTAGMVSLLCFALAYPTAEFIARASDRLRPFLLAVMVVPLWSSVIARTYGWFGVFVRDGVVDRIAGVFGAGPQMLLYSETAVIVGMVHVLLPIMLLPVYAAVRGYDNRLSLASLSLGAGRLRTLLLVKLPVLAPLMLVATTGIFIIALGFFVTPALLGGPRSQLISTLVYQQVSQRFDLPRAQAMSIILLIAALGTLALLAVVSRSLRRRVR